MTPDELVFMSFYTPNYQWHGKRLLQSLKRFGYRRHIAPVKSQGSWLLMVRWKPTFIYKTMARYPDAKAFVWLDADAFLMDEPTLLFHIKEDLACRFLYWQRNRKVEIHLGTFFFRNNRAGKAVIKAWVEAMKTAPMNLRCPEQQVLYELLTKLRPRTLNLPERYCHVMRHTDKRAVIAQWQQSREEREPEKLKRLMDQEDQPAIHQWEYDLQFMKGKDL